MRRPVVLVLAAGSLVVGFGAAAMPRAHGSWVDRRAGISVRVPAVLHVVRAKLTNLVDPNLRVAVASFPVKVSSQPCVCDRSHAPV
jgi:hypothetical protein